MSNFLFGCGYGHLSTKAAKAAKAAGATLVNHVEPRGEKRHWFAGPNYGAGQDQQLASAVLAAVRAAATKADKKLLA
jgi:hypothetical protein